MNIKLGKEIFFAVPNKVGQLSAVSEAVANAGINIEGIVGYAKEGLQEADIMLITNNNEATINTLKNIGYSAIKEKDILILEIENKPGTLKAISSKLSENGIDIKYIYGTTAAEGFSKIILSTGDNQKTLQILKG